MKVRAAGTMVVLLVCLCGRLLPGAEAADPGALIAAAEKANVAGDKIAALKGFAEAANALRTSGAPQAKIDGCVAEKDRLRPRLGHTPKCPKNGRLQRQNPTTFLARHGSRRKCFGQACMPACPRITPRSAATGVIDAPVSTSTGSSPVRCAMRRSTTSQYPGLISVP